jgi:hypothetical protein
LIGKIETQSAILQTTRTVLAIIKLP